MQLNCSPLITAKVPVQPGAPAWVDPRAIMAQCAFRFQEVAILLQPQTLLAPADPKRVAIGFSAGLQGGMQVAPHQNPDRGGFYVGFNNLMITPWFSIFDFGPMVNEAWYVGQSANTWIVVYEIYRLN